jgi:hypothetical protein
MNEEEIQLLYNEIKGTYKLGSIEEFKNYLNDDSKREMFFNSVIKPGNNLKNLSEFESLYGLGSQKKNQVVTSPSSGQEALTDSTTKTEAALGSLDSLKRSTLIPEQVSVAEQKSMDLAKELKLKKGKLDKEDESVSKLFNEDFDINESQYLKDRLLTVNKQLINREEEFVVPQLRYQFGDLDFDFEESGVGDFVTVTASNKKKIQISLDNFSDSKSQKQSEILQNFIKENTPKKGLFVLEKTQRDEDFKFNSEKEVEKYSKSINDSANALNKKQKNFILRKKDLNKEILRVSALTERTPENLLAVEKTKNLSDALFLEMNEILNEEEGLKNKANALDIAVGKYSLSKSEQGTWLGALGNALTRGSSSTTAGLTAAVIDGFTELAPTGFGAGEEGLKIMSVDISKKLGITPPAKDQTIEQWKETLTSEQLEDWEDGVDDSIKKQLKSDLLPSIRTSLTELVGDSDTAAEFSQIKSEGFWGGAILGVTGSLPAMLGNLPQRMAQMYAQVSDGLAQEMESDPDFEDITENEKLAITLPIGIVSASLENLGLRNLKASKGLINSVTLSVLNKSKKGITANSFRELVENEVESKIGRGLLIMTAAGAAEFETGAAQELSETSFKAIYNTIKDKEMFDTPDSLKELVFDVARAGAQEAVGGFVLGVPSAISSAYSKKGFLKMGDNEFSLFLDMANDDRIQSAYISKLKNLISQGTITQKEAKGDLNNYRNSVSLFRQIPEGLTMEESKEAMNLLKEKKDLENFIEGKDVNLVVSQKERIQEINDSLSNITQKKAEVEEEIDDSELPTGEVTGQPIEDKLSEPIELSVLPIGVNDAVIDVDDTGVVTETDVAVDEEQAALNKEIESFANRIVKDGTQDFGDDAITFYEENQEVIDNLVTEKNKEVARDASKQRNLAVKIARGDDNFSDADIDLYAASEQLIKTEVEAIAKTSNETITEDTYKNILDSIKSTTKKDKSKVESENTQRKNFWKSWNKASRESKADLKGKRKDLNNRIKEFSKGRKGSVSSAQLGAVSNKVNSVNLDNSLQVDKLIDYMDKVFNNADYADKLSK